VPDFIIAALLAGIGLALVAGPLGSFVVWQRLSYFGDTLAHSALLGIALGLATDINLSLAVIICACMIAILLVLLSKRTKLAQDSILGILSHTSLAFGLVVISLTANNQLDLSAYLFGDLLSIDQSQLLLIAAVVVLSLLIIIRFWHALLAVAIHPELAEVEGFPVLRLQLLLSLLIAVLVAAAIKRATSPEAMAILASVYGSISVCAGMATSWFVDTPTGPSIVVCCAIIFIISLLPAFRRA
jgi:zinc transport system permease protein